MAPTPSDNANWICPDGQSGAPKLFFQGQPPRCYFKRYKMEKDVGRPNPVPTLPQGYSWREWETGLANDHALALFQSFQMEMDARVFQSFKSLAGCQKLMQVLSFRLDFLPQVTWLIQSSTGPCGTIQAILQSNGLVAIQNIGVSPGHRGLGLGTTLIQKLMDSAGQWNLPRASLEVTAENLAAIRLYKRLGFTKTKLLYKEVDLPSPVANFLDTSNP